MLRLVPATQPRFQFQTRRQKIRWSFPRIGALVWPTMLATPERIHAAARSPGLEELLPRWREFPLYQNLPVALELSELPIITKRELALNFPHNFLRPGQNLEALLAEKQVELEYTSGTSDERTPVLFGRGWWNEQEARVLRLNPLVAQVLDEKPAARRATLTPPVCNGLVCFSNWHSQSARTVENTLFVNLARIPFVLGEKEFARMAGEISAWSPQFLDLDPVHGAWFALYCERNGIRFPSVRFNLCSYEFVSVVHRRIIERVFGVPVFNFYGSTEAGHLLMENERGEMMPSHENAFYEIVAPDERGIGDLIVTTWTNEFMPLLRYRTGDLAQRGGPPQAPHYRIHGRARDGWLRRDGRRVTTLEMDQCFQGIAGIAHYYLRQIGPDAGQLQYVPDRVAPGAAELALVTARLEELLELSHQLVVEPVKMLPPLASGKFRLTQGL